VATIPVGLTGLLFDDYIEANFRNPLFVAGTLTFFGILMYLADRFGRGTKDEFGLTWPQALAIGCAQAHRAVARINAVRKAFMGTSNLKGVKQMDARK